jgi:hypothetical protein
MTPESCTSSLSTPAVKSVTVSVEVLPQRAADDAVGQPDADRRRHHGRLTTVPGRGRGPRPRVVEQARSRRAARHRGSRLEPDLRRIDDAGELHLTMLSGNPTLTAGDITVV